ERMKPGGRIALQRRMVAADAVQARDEVLEARRLVPIPRAHLVFLRVQVLFRAALARAIVHELERRSIDAIARSERRREDEPCDEGGPAAELQILGEDVRGIGPEARAEELTHRAGAELGEVVDDL